MWSVAGMQYENIGDVDGFVGEKKKRREIMDAVEIPVKKTEAVRCGAKEGGSRGKAPAAQSAARGPDEGVPAASGPQYKYSTPIEDPKIAKGVIERALDAKIELSQRELLALSPEVRKQIKELTTTKRTAVVGVMEATDEEAGDVVAFFQDEDESERVSGRREVIAEECVPLRCLEAVVEDKAKVTCILDQGCQIIAMSRRVWEKLHLSILSDRVINMTSANSSVERSLGLMPRLRLRFGLVEMVVQAHVMDNAPFDILLGRPFFQAGLCHTIDFANGEQHITITDPATRHEVTIPTHT